MNERSHDSLFLHADGDSFFVACELSQNPEYRGLPVVVGEDRGIAVAMSPEAKNLGVTRGMPVFQIKRRFPSVIILPHHFDVYRRISDGVYAILLSYLDTVEIYSIDECFAEVKMSDVRFFGGEKKLAIAIQNEIWRTFGVTYSIGIARTKALAKTASKLNKPHGVALLLTELDEHEALRKTDIEDVWGIGRRTAPRLVQMGIRTAYDFITYSSDHIERFFSEPLRILQLELSGQSIHTISSDTDPRNQQSIQSTSTFRPPSNDAHVIWSELSDNAEHACARARELRLLTNSVSFFVKTTEFVHYFADAKLSVFTTDPGIVLNALEPYLSRTLAQGQKIRSTGIILHSLQREEDVPRDLFGTQDTAIDQLVVERVADTIRKKFGRGALMRASSQKESIHERGNSFPKHG
ncbi:MAG: hypothetical protein WCG55_01545 [bacterium]